MVSGLLGNGTRTAVEEAIVRARLRAERRQRAERILGLNWRLFGPRWRKGLKRDRGFRPGSAGDAGIPGEGRPLRRCRR